MKEEIIILFILTLLFSCNSKSKKFHKDYLGFKTSFLAEMGEEKYDLLQEKVSKGFIETSNLEHRKTKNKARIEATNTLIQKVNANILVLTETSA